MMKDKCSAGCVRGGVSTSGQYTYRPIVVVAHDGVYFARNSFVELRLALKAADQAIEHNTFRDWHYHELKHDH